MMIKRASATALLSTLILATPLNALAANIPSRWFEVEVIMFTRDTPSDSIREEFGQQVKPIRYHRNRDLLSRYHYPDIKHLFKTLSLSSGLCSPEARLMATAPMPRIEDVTTMPAIDETAEINADVQIEPIADFVAPDVTLIASKPKKSCLEPDPWFTPFAFITDDPYKHRSFDYHYDMYPRVIDAGEKYNDLRVHLMTKRNFRLREIYRTLRRQPNTRPILHTAWRQPAGAIKRMRATRLYGGIDFSEDYDFQGRPIVKDAVVLDKPDTNQPVSAVSKPAVSVVDNIERLLTLVDQGANINYQTQQIEPTVTIDDVNDPDEVREIDGLFKIYVDVFNYLHIDAEFNIRREGVTELIQSQNRIDTLLRNQPVDDSSAVLTSTLSDATAVDHEETPKVLNNYHFKQTRRVITKELHYFDHPYMGMIVQIRRWGW